MTIFLLVGVAATLLDLGTYFVLIHNGLSEDSAKVISFFTGTTLGYFGNSRYTFHKRQSRPLRYFLTYSISLALNVWINGFVYSVWENRLMGWLIATATSTIFNFLGLRYFAFIQKV